MNKFRLISFAILLAVLVTACGSAAVEATNFAPQAADEILIQATPAMTMASEGAGPAIDPGSPGQLAFAQNPSCMVIKDANLELLVADTRQTLSRITQMSADYGGYIISAQTWTENDVLYATLRLGIPSTAFEVTLTQLREMGVEVLKETASGQDVSAEYVDLQSQFVNLEATATRVRSFLADATTVEEALQVNKELSRLEAEIAQVQGQIRFYEGRSAFSTVTVNLVPELVIPPTTPARDPVWDPGETFLSATNVLKGLAQGTADFLIWALVLFAPFGVVLVLLFWFVRFSLARFQR